MSALGMPPIVAEGAGSSGGSHTWYVKSTLTRAGGVAGASIVGGSHTVADVNVRKVFNPASLM
jgi:hypothetical protein